MYVYYVDDSRQKSPSRPSLRPLVARGYIAVSADKIHALERALEARCAELGLGPDDEFKWSPDRGSKFRGIEADKRSRFQKDVVAIALASEAVACVVAVEEGNSPLQAFPRVDDSRGSQRLQPGAEADALLLLTERIAKHSSKRGGGAVVIEDRPRGGGDNKWAGVRKSDLLRGSRWTDFESVACILTAQSRTHRLLQMSDLIVGAVTSRLAGEDTYSPAIVEALLTLLEGGIGRALKLHPDFRLDNLYFHLLGATWNIKGRELPVHGVAWCCGEDQAECRLA